MKQLLKVLNADLTSPFQGFKFELGKEYHCPDFDEDVTQDCSRGFYATEVEGLLYSLRPGRIVVSCDVSGKEVEINQFKRRYEYITLKKILPEDTIKLMAKEQDSSLGYILSESLFPVNPLTMNKILPSIGDKEICLLAKWASVGDSVWSSVRKSVWESVWSSVRKSVWESVWSSVGDSVWSSVRKSVGDSVGESVWDSVRKSVWDSVRKSVWESVWSSVRKSVRKSVWDSVGDSVQAYTSSLFPNIKKWKYIDHPEGVTPFLSGIDLWRRGIIPSFDGKVWRLHAGPKMEIVYTMPS